MVINKDENIIASAMCHYILFRNDFQAMIERQI